MKYITTTYCKHIHTHRVHGRVSLIADANFGDFAQGLCQGRQAAVSLGRRRPNELVTSDSRSSRPFFIFCLFGHHPSQLLPELVIVTLAWPNLSPSLPLPLHSFHPSLHHSITPSLHHSITPFQTHSSRYCIVRLLGHSSLVKPILRLSGRAPYTRILTTPMSTQSSLISPIYFAPSNIP
jgi:hypothetical protein